MRPLLSSPSHLWTSSASLSHLAAMSASIAFAGSVGACSVKARQSAARPRYRLVLDVVSLCTLIVSHPTLRRFAVSSQSPADSPFEPREAPTRK